MVHIIRSGRIATLVEEVTPDDVFCASVRRTDYTEYRGLLCRTWNAGNGQGPQFQEIGGGLRPAGRTIPISADADIAKIVQMEIFPIVGYLPRIEGA